MRACTRALVSAAHSICAMTFPLLPAHASGAAAPAAPDNRPFAPIQASEDDSQVIELQMFVGESRVFPAPGVARIAVGNGALLTASVLDHREVILFANAAGTSSLFLWNEDGRHQRVKISIVPGDTSRHAREVAAFLSTIPKARASVVGSHIIVEGDELSDADIAKIEELAKRYPQIVNFTNRVGWERMVMLDVKVVEFPTSVLRDIGLAWSPTGGAAIAGLWAPARRGSSGPFEVAIRTGNDSGVPVTSPGGTPAPLPSGLNAVAFMNLGLNAQLNLLAQEGKASLLAQPQLSARSGSKASFLAGGEIPYAVATRDGIAVQFKPYGVHLEITPRVDHQGVIRATIQTEVSGIDRSVTTSSGPALLSRKTETEFNLHDGETLVLAGLLQREVSSDVDKVPVLGDLPVLGALFRSQRFQNKETELVVFVTPTVVDAGTPALAERVRRAQERLQEQQGVGATLPTPQSRIRPDQPPAIASPHVDGGSWLTVVADGTGLRAAPDARAALLLTLDAGAAVRLGAADAPAADGSRAWRHVVVGAVNGWVPLEAVRPRSTATRGLATAVAPSPPAPPAPPAPLVPLVPPGDTPGRTHGYSVEREGLALRSAPDINAEVLLRLTKGERVLAAGATRGAWTAVRAGDGTAAPRGWVATQWLAPLADAPSPEAAP